MVMTQTPFRVSFFGGGTDYKPYFEAFGGAVMSTSIDKYCYINVKHISPFLEYKIQLLYSITESVNSVDEIKHPSARACMKHTGMDDLVMHYDADLPARSGLGSSSAFTVGLLNAIHALKGEYVAPVALGKEAIYVEQELIGENVGVQDQLAAAVGGLNVMEFTQDDLYIRPVIISAERKRILNEHLLLVYTGLPRFASKIAAEQVRLTPRRTAELDEMKRMVYEGERILTVGNDLQDFGRLLNEGWKLKRSLTSQITNDKIDEIYEVALRNGAIGGKLLGAGGGGYVLLFAEPERQRTIIEKLGLICVHFGFESLGSKVIFYRN